MQNDLLVKGMKLLNYPSRNMFDNTRKFQIDYPIIFKEIFNNLNLNLILIRQIFADMFRHAIHKYCKYKGERMVYFMI